MGLIVKLIEICALTSLIIACVNCWRLDCKEIENFKKLIKNHKK
jgi:hypothetical protein